MGKSRMPCSHWNLWLTTIGLLVAMACAAPHTADPDIVRPLPGEPPLKQLPGPLLISNSYQSALLTACQKIVSKPKATAGRREGQDFQAYWRVGTEYCAWIYYTPDGKYVLSRLTDQTSMGLADQSKRCLLPSYVDDRRFPAGSIKYIFAIHNHLYDDLLSEPDLFWIIDEGKNHGFEAETKDGPVRLSVIAFFSNEIETPRCDGFYQYIPLTGQLRKWTRTTKWECEQTHRVEWDTGFARVHIKEARASCVQEAPP
jgi:hypothetical protein